jgi:hypothetical protein
MKYLKKRFSVSMTSEVSQEQWDSIFNKNKKCIWTLSEGWDNLWETSCGDVFAGKLKVCPKCNKDVE